MFKKSEIKTDGFQYSMPDDLESDLRSFLSQPNPDIRIIHCMGIKDQTALIADIQTDEGIIRVGYYNDGAFSVLDDCTDINSVEEWASWWDEPGDDPKFWNANHILPLLIRKIEAEAELD